MSFEHRPPRIPNLLSALTALRQAECSHLTAYIWAFMLLVFGPSGKSGLAKGRLVLDLLALFHVYATRQAPDDHLRAKEMAAIGGPAAAQAKSHAGCSVIDRESPWVTLLTGMRRARVRLLAALHDHRSVVMGGSSSCPRSLRASRPTAGGLVRIALQGPSGLGGHGPRATVICSLTGQGVPDLLRLYASSPGLTNWLRGCRRAAAPIWAEACLA